MKIIKLEIDRFAGLKNRTIEFNKGLNLLFGPNESGKSSVVDIILALLFTSSKPKKREFDTVVKRWIPIGSDSAKVKGSFEFSKHGTYTVEKVWGANSYTLLTTPGGDKLSDPAEIQNIINELLPCSETLFREILCFKQGELENTFDVIEAEDGIVHDLGELIRRAFINSGGVSIDKLSKTLELKLEQLLAKWDVLNDSPMQKERGGVYLRGTGLVYDQYLTVKSLDRDYKEAILCEEKVESNLLKLNSTEKEKQELELYLKKNEKIVKQLQDKKLLLETVKGVISKETKLKEGQRSWPVLEDRVLSGESLLKQLKSDYEIASKDKDLAIIFSKNRERRAKYQRVLKRERELKELSEKLISILVYPRSRYEELERKSYKLDGLSSSDLSDIKFDFKSKDNLKLRLLAEDGEQQVAVVADEELTLTLKNSTIVKSDRWEFTLSLDCKDKEVRSEERLDLRASIKKDFDFLGVNNLSGAKQIMVSYEDILRATSRAEAELKRELGLDSVSKLKDEFGDLLRPEQTNIVLEDAILKFDELSAKVTTLKLEIDGNKKLINELVTLYKDQDTLFDLLFVVKTELKSLTKKIESLPEIAESKLQAYIDNYYSSERRYMQLIDYYSHFKEAHFSLLQDLPESSAEELKVELREAKSCLEDYRNTADTLNRVKSEILKIKEETEGNSFTPVINKFREKIENLTGMKYIGLEIHGSSDCSVKNLVDSNSVIIPRELLSKGATDTIALALRAVLSDYFLEERSGMIILDDPFVDLDDKRRELALELIKNISMDKQVLFFSCHQTYIDASSDYCSNLSHDFSIN